jgi:hypothetical protein
MFPNKSGNNQFNAQHLYKFQTKYLIGMSAKDLIALSSTVDDVEVRAVTPSSPLNRTMEKVETLLVLFISSFTFYPFIYILF